jgi:CRP/FNR family cyclic AMP-dependent transcriptional regulator
MDNEGEDSKDRIRGVRHDPSPVGPEGIALAKRYSVAPGGPPIEPVADSFAPVTEEASMDETRLKTIPLFADLSHHEREQVAQWADEVDVAEGKHLVEQGEFGYEFFVIEDGTAEVRRNDEKIAELGPGDFFGEVALLGEDRRNASVIATSPLRAIVMFGREFRTMEGQMPHVAATIRQACEERRPTR